MSAWERQSLDCHEDGTCVCAYVMHLTSKSWLIRLRPLFGAVSYADLLRAFDLKVVPVVYGWFSWTCRDFYFGRFKTFVRRMVAAISAGGEQGGA